MIKGGMLPAGGATDFFEPFNFVTLIHPLHYPHGFAVEWMLTLWTNKQASKCCCYTKQQFQDRHTLAAESHATWPSSLLATHLVPHEGMPTVWMSANTHWRKKMKKKAMKLNELSALQRETSERLQHLGTLWFRAVLLKQWVSRVAARNVV